MLAEKAGIELRVGPRLHRAVHGRLEWQDMIADAELGQLGDELVARLAGRGPVKELPAADHQPQRHLAAKSRYHSSPLIPRTLKATLWRSLMLRAAVLLLVLPLL